MLVDAERCKNDHVQQVALRLLPVYISNSDTYLHALRKKKSPKSVFLTHFTHMHASHTTWLINSNLNGCGLTSYTHAF